MTQQELDAIIEKHQHWLKEDCEGWEGMKADLSMQCFYGANFYGANCEGANFKGANFKGASLDDSEKHRLGTILTKPMTGYKKTREGVVSAHGSFESY